MNDGTCFWKSYTRKFWSGIQNLCLFEITKILNPPVELHHYENLQVAKQEKPMRFRKLRSTKTWSFEKFDHVFSASPNFWPSFLVHSFLSISNLLWKLSLPRCKTWLFRCTRGRWSWWRDDRIAWIYGWGGLVEWNDLEGDRCQQKHVLWTKDRASWRLFWNVLKYVDVNWLQNKNSRNGHTDHTVFSFWCSLMPGKSHEGIRFASGILQSSHLRPLNQNLPTTWDV